MGCSCVMAQFRATCMTCTYIDACSDHFDILEYLNELHVWSALEQAMQATRYGYISIQIRYPGYCLS